MKARKKRAIKTAKLRRNYPKLCERYSGAIDSIPGSGGNPSTYLINKIDSLAKNHHLHISKVKVCHFDTEGVKKRVYLGIDVASTQHANSKLESAFCTDDYFCMSMSNDPNSIYKC